MADTFEEDKKIENNLSDYDYIIRTGLSLEQQLKVWNDKHATLRADVPAAKKAELDSLKLVAVNKFKTALGL